MVKRSSSLFASLFASLLLCGLGGLLALTPATSDACGPYGDPKQSFSGEISTQLPDIVDFEVVARCDGQLHEGYVDEDGSFWVWDIAQTAKACTVRAVAIDSEGRVHGTRERVELPSEVLALRID